MENDYLPIEKTQFAWVVANGANLYFTRHTLSTATESPLTDNEILIGLLCEYINKLREGQIAKEVIH